MSLHSAEWRVLICYCSCSWCSELNKKTKTQALTFQSFCSFNDISLPRWSCWQRLLSSKVIESTFSKNKKKKIISFSDVFLKIPTIWPPQITSLVAPFHPWTDIFFWTRIVISLLRSLPAIKLTKDSRSAVCFISPPQDGANKWIWKPFQALRFIHFHWKRTWIDSPRRVLQIVFWLRDDNVERRAAKFRWKGSAVSAISRPRRRPATFGTHRLLRSNFTQKTFDRTTHGLSDGAKFNQIRS